MKSTSKATEAIRKRYDRWSFLFDFVERFGGKRLSQWRTFLWSNVEGKVILEVGVGTGANFPYYPHNANVTAIDLSDRMLNKARDKAHQQGFQVHLEVMDVQNLRFKDNVFDTVIASLVFCSVPDPVAGLKEISRVCKPRGKVVLLEHVLSSNQVVEFFQNLLNPLTLWVFGENLNRKTAENVSKSGLIIERVHDLTGIFKLMEARK